MLSDIIKQAGDWDTKALAEIFSDKKFLRSVYKNYLIDLVSESFGYQGNTVTLPREIIPDSLTLGAFCYIHEKDPLTLPILLRYFTHKNLLEEAKDDLDKINQKLQSVMDKDLKDLQDKKAKLQADKTNLNNVEMHDKKAKALATDEINKQITKTSSEIEKLELYKGDIKNLLNGNKVKSRFYPSKYFSILNDGIIEIMEKKLTAYVKDNTDIGETYQSLNSRVKKIIRVRNVKNTLVLSAPLAFFIPCISVMYLGLFCMGVQHGPQPSFLFPMIDITLFYIVPIMLSIAVALCATAGVAHLIKRRYEQSFEKEMQDFIEGPKRAEKATNEDVKKLEQEGTKVGDYGKKPSAPPCDEPKQLGLYPNLSEEQPPSYEEACRTIVQLEDSGPSSNLDFAEPDERFLHLTIVLD